MLTRKPCKWCGSIWHSKAKCKERVNKPYRSAYAPKRTHTQLLSKSPSERPILAYKGKSERSQLIGYADRYFSWFIRKRFSSGGHNTCYTCGLRAPYKELQCGHFMSRRYFNTRWHELNCWPQCNECNVVKGGNLVEYERRLRNQFGDDAIDELQRLAHTGGKISTLQIENIVEKYKGVVF